MKADIEMPKTDNSIVEYKLWYTSIYDLPKQLILDLYMYNLTFEDKVKFEPKILTLKGSKSAPKYLKDKDCFTNGKYCFISPKHDLRLEQQFHASPEEPRKILEETIREKCLFKINDQEHYLRDSTSYVKERSEGGGDREWFSYMY